MAELEREAGTGPGASSGVGSPAGGVARNQNVVYTLPFDAASLAQVLAPVMERIEAHTTEPQVLVVTPDADTALTAARVASQLAGDRGLMVLPATGTARAARLLRARPAHVIAGAPAELLGLIQSSTLKLERVRLLVLAWLDDVLATGADAALESIMNEVPKEAARIVAASRVTEPVDAFIERYLRRARRVGEGVGDAPEPVSLRYVAVAGAARVSALRRLLDELDPASTTVFVRSDESEAEVDALRRTLGYGEEDALRIARGAGDATEPRASALVVLYDVPGSRPELRAALGTGGGQVVALVHPRQLDLLRHLAGEGEVTPLVLSSAAANARSSEAAMRDELRAVLADGAPSRELLALEPLMEEYDGVELAAAALRLLERERERAQERSRERASARASAASAASGDWTRVFINVGERDGVRVGDIVGAITGEADLAREQIGRVELRESHSLVEIAPGAAAKVVERLTGTMIRGRRAAARLDRMEGERGGGERRPAGRGAPRGSRPSFGGPRGGSGGSRGSAGPRGGERGPRGRGERPDRPGGSDRGPRRPRREDRE